MYNAVVHYPDVDLRAIELLRRKYDPTVGLIEPHLTIMFPVPESVVKGATLVRHLENVLGKWKPFAVRLRGFRESPDHWLFLVLEEGNADVIRLYQDILTGVLASYRKDDIEFIPHVSLGLFVREGTLYDWRQQESLPLDEERYAQALRESESLGLDFRCVVDKLHLVKIGDDVIKWMRGESAKLPEGSRVVRCKELLLSAST